jgi:sigma-E factor negative regulatory protein RseA
MVIMDGISALMDGELEDREAERELAKLKDDAALRERWNTFHLVGDALRGEPLLSAGFRENFTVRLAAEPTVLAPRRSTRQTKRVATYALSAAASLSAAALVAWVAIAPTGTVGLQAAKSPVELQTALVPPSASAVVTPLPTASSDGSMNEYLLAHQGFSPSTALQGLAPYIRSVSATRTVDGR